MIKLKKKYSLALSFLISQLIFGQISSVYSNSCYDRKNKPVRCLPDFVNAAYNKTVHASNTCGLEETEYCLQTNRYSDYEKCDLCDMRRPDKSHPAEYINDYKNEAGLTWWQSDTMEYGIQYPNFVNITIHLGKSFDLTYIQVKFFSSRPESFAIYKRTNETSEWEPYQYYSASCKTTYNKEINEIVEKDDEATALCSDEFSDIAPLSGGSVAFSTLEGRPSAYAFEQSNELKEWVTATDIRLSLNRLNTFGDDIFGDPKVLRSYFYAISDISIGGRCKCNGHAERCEEFEDHNLDSRLRCACEHNTAGVDCDRCAPFYNDRPWAAATYDQPNECLPCNCNGLSNKCEFRQELYDKSGHGGYCIDCQRNTEGQFCENCKHGFYRGFDNNECLDCQCHPEGSQSVQCAPNGQCICKPGVMGLKCDQCKPNHYDLTNQGCKTCQCEQSGSYHSPPRCNPINGKCDCKDYVEGQNCDRCKPGYFNLDANSTQGCLQCFCFGHSSQCSSAFNYISVDLTTGDKTWTATNLDKSVQKIVSIENDAMFIYNTDEDIWFNAPDHFLGNQRNSYNQDLSFKLRFKLSHSSAIRKDFILEGNGLEVHRPIYDTIEEQRFYDLNGIQPDITKEYRFILKENDGWRPTLSRNDFQRLLSNLTSIRIKTTYGGLNFLSDFNLKSAKNLPALAFQTDKELDPINWIENCVCPEGYIGQFCENCQVGFTREIPFTDSFTRCVQCSCNNHSIACNPTSGECDCIHNTVGENCERCKDGYYGNALVGSPIDCKECPCPERGPCAEIYNYQSESMDVVCLACPEGTRGNLCDMCEDGYYGYDGKTCKKCDCNGNIDENAIENCDRDTGKCLRCVFNTTNDQCQDCLPGYWGDALADVKCHACECSPDGSTSLECELNNGQCMCKPNVVGRQCDKCEPQFWNITSGEGCTECKCSPLGSIDLNCDESGQCKCQPGVMGLKCDQCMPNYFNFSGDGCKPCECNNFGSYDAKCDDLGRCTCRENIAGNKCDKCQENYSNFTLGCIKCDDCYDLVENKVFNLREDIQGLDYALEDFNPDDVPNETKEKNKKLKIYLDEFTDNIEKLHASLYSNDLKSSYDESMEQAQRTFKEISEEVKTLAKDIEIFDVEVEKFQKDKKSLTVLKNKNDLLASSYVNTLYTITAHLEGLENEAPAIEDNALKNKNLAKKSRLASQEQKKIASEFAATVRSHIKDARDSIFKLDRLASEIFAFAAMPIVSKNQKAITTAESLVAEAADLKLIFEKEAVSISSINDELEELDMIQKEIESDDYIELMEKRLDESSERTNSFYDLQLELSEHVKDYKDQIEDKVLDTQDRIRNVEIMENDMSKLLERSERAEDSTSKAIELINTAYKNASNMLETFENFESVHQTNINNANEAMKLITDIDINVKECRLNHESVSSTLEVSKANKNQASYLVDQFKSLINDSIPKSSNLLNVSKALEIKQIDLSKDMSNLETKIANMSIDLENARTTNETFGSRIHTLQQSVKTIGINTNILLTNLNDADEEIENLNSDFIKKFKDITVESIDELSKKFENALEKSEEFSDRYEADVQDLVERNAYNQQILVIFEREIPEIRKQIENLNLLKSSLETKCNYYLKRKLRR